MEETEDKRSETSQMRTAQHTMSSSVKFSPPTWDSDKDSPSWRDFSHKFESFVDYQPGGIILLNLALHILGKTNKFVATESALDDDLSFDASQGKTEDREVTSVKELNPAECKLDRSLYNILDSCVSGTKRDAILSVHQRSWIQAWVALNREMGATTIKRKTVLMNDLIGLEFTTSKDAKHATMQLIRKIYETKINMEEFMMYCITQSFPEEFLALKIMLNKKIEESKGTPNEVYDFVTFAYNTLEMTENSPQSTRALKVRTQKHCDRCGWTNHEAKDCYATKHRNGTDLPPNGNQRPTSIKRAKDPSQEEAEEPSTIEEAKAKAKAEAVATAKRLLAKAQAMRAQTQEVE